MWKLVFGMMPSLEGYVAGVAGGLQLPPPGTAHEIGARYQQNYLTSL
jgi:hypothetical protein